MGFPVSSVVKNPAMQETWLERSPGGGKLQPTPVFLLGKSHGQRNLAGYSPKGHKELNTTWGLNNNSLGRKEKR